MNTEKQKQLQHEKKKLVSLPLLQDEEVINFFTASYETGSSFAPSWRLGNLYLTNKRLLFIQGRKISFGILLNQIKTINIVKRKWILGKEVKQLNIVCAHRRAPYICVKNPEEWKQAIEEQASFVKASCQDGTALFDRATTSVIPTHNSQLITHSSEHNEVILKGKGGYLSPGQQKWRVGTLLLTNKKLAFLQSASIVWEIPLGNIKDLRIERKVYGVSKSDAICVVYERGEIRKVWIISPDLETWRKKLYEKALLKIDVETLDKLATKLDPDSRKILWFLYENRHARIDTLAELIKADTHMDVLLKIRKTINPTAEKIIGYPILSFESSKFDWETSENITFSWWLTRQPQKIEKEPILDIFDENSHIVVYLEILGAEVNDIQLDVRRDKLIISVGAYRKEIQLPVIVDTSEFTKKYKNNILEVRLKKAKHCGL